MTPPETRPNRPVPTEGMPATLHRLAMAFGINYVPQLSLSEQLRLEQEARMRQKAAAIQRLNELTDLVPTLNVAFIGVKGGAATTTTMAHAASVMGDNTRTMLVASDFNPASGTGAARLGKDYDETVTLRELLRDLDNLEVFRDFIRRIRPTRYSVRVVSANDITSSSDHLTGGDAKRMLNTISCNAEYHYIDTANDITDEVTLAAVETADVPVFTANVEVHDSLRQLGTGMETLRRHGFRDKVDNGVVIISNVPPGVALDEFRMYLNKVNIRNKIVQRYDFFGQFLGIPYDPIIKRDTEVELEPLAWETFQAYLELDIAILEQGLLALSEPHPPAHT